MRGDIMKSMERSRSLHEVSSIEFVHKLSFCFVRNDHSLFILGREH